MTTLSDIIYHKDGRIYINFGLIGKLQEGLPLKSMPIVLGQINWSIVGNGWASAPMTSEEFDKNLEGFNPWIERLIEQGKGNKENP